MAVEDAVSLSALLNKARSGRDVQKAALSYETIRRERTAAVQAAVLANTTLWHLQDGKEQESRDSKAQITLLGGARSCSPYIFDRPEGQEFLYGSKTEVDAHSHNQ